VKIRAVWFVAAFVMILLCHASSAQAASLSDLLGFKPASDRTYSYNVTNSGQSQYPQAVQYQAPAQPITPAKRTQSMGARKQVSQRRAYQRPIPQTQSNPRQATSSTARSKGKASHKGSAKPSLQSMMTLPPHLQANSRVAYSYQPVYPSQPSNASLQGYRQARAPVYYSNPYQPRYTPPRNYYQGYSYNTWGSGASAKACAPGRA
jgi:hypothetical protein